MISRYNHLAQGDHSKGTKFQNGCFAFCHCFRGGDKRDRRKLNCEGHRTYVIESGSALLTLVEPKSQKR